MHAVEERLRRMHPRRSATRMCLAVCAACAAHLAGYSTAFATPDPPAVDELTDVADLDRMDLESLLDLPIVSVSKRVERYLSSPLAISIVTRADIDRSGALSIPEALRLVAGTLVREISPGVFEVYLRGFDMVPPSQLLHTQQSRMTLVMVDNRVVFKSFWGMTIWESVGVGIEDVQTIEVVRGGASALYGPNAATGVINIITRKPEVSGLHNVVRTVLGTSPGSETRLLSTAQGEVSSVYRNDALGIRISADWTRRQRHVTRYKAVANDDVFESAEDIVFFLGEPFNTVADPQEAYPEPTVAMRSAGVSGAVDYRPRHDEYVTATAGWRSSAAHSTRVDMIAAVLTFQRFHTTYAQVQGRSGSLSALVDYEAFTGTTGIGDLSDFDMFKWSATLDYDLELGLWEIHPGFYTSSTSVDGGPFAQREALTQYACSLHIETTRGPFRFIGAGRVEQFADSEGWTFPFQLAATFVPYPNQVLRVVAGRSFASASLFEQRQDTLFAHGTPMAVHAVGTPGVAKRQIDSVDLGYRTHVERFLFLDLELFAAKMSRIVALQYAGTMEGGGMLQQYLPTDVVAIQTGVTASASLMLGGASLKLFATAQRSRAEDYADTYVLPVPPQLRSSVVRSTPAVFGGLVANWAASNSLNINVNAYGYTEQVFLHPMRATSVEARPKLLVNVAARIVLTDGMRVFATWRNTLRDKAHEYFRTDPIMSTVALGLRLQM